MRLRERLHGLTDRSRVAAVGHPWSIVLAGGEGQRTRSFVRARFGHDKPKQYCSFVGTRSLLQHTIARADTIASPTHRVIVAARHHRLELTEQVTSRSENGTVLFQPRNLDTAPGVFLPLSRVLAADPQATVIIFPSDHFIYPETRFVEAMSNALELDETIGGRPLLIGVEPDHPESEYGWIETGDVRGSANGALARCVRRFVEKPPRETAQRLSDAGSLWNTSILVSKAAELWRLGWKHLPELMPSFARIRQAFETDADDRQRLDSMLATVYSRLPARNFSRHLLEPASSRLSVMKLEGCAWNDWGSPARILATLDRLRSRSANGESDVAWPMVADVARASDSLATSRISMRN